MEPKQLDSEPPRRATFAQLPYLLTSFCVSVLIWIYFYLLPLSSPLEAAAIYFAAASSGSYYLFISMAVSSATFSNVMQLQSCMMSPQRALLVCRYRSLIASMVCARRPCLHARRGSFHWRDLTTRYARAPLLLGEFWRVSESDFERFLADFGLPADQMFGRWKGRFPAERLVPWIVRGRVPLQNVFLQRFGRGVSIHGAAPDYMAALSSLTGAFQHRDVSDLAAFAYELLRLYNDQSAVSRALTVGALLQTNVVKRMVMEHGPALREWLELLVKTEALPSTSGPPPLDIEQIEAQLRRQGLEVHASAFSFERLYNLGPLFTQLPHTPLVKGAVTVATLFLETSAFKRLRVSKSDFAAWVALALASAKDDATFVAKFVTYITFLVRRCQVAWESGDLYDLLGTSVFVTWTQDVLAEKDAVDAFRHFKAPYDQAAGLLRIAALRETGDRLKNENRATDYYYSQLLAVEKFVRETLTTVRDVPFGIIMTGASGIGKTLMVNVLEDLVRAKHSLPDTNLTHFHTDTKHQEVVGMPALYVWNDALSTRDEKLDTPTLAFMQALVDSAPFRVSAASIEAKAASAVEPKIVVVTTNEKSFTCTQSTTGADKLDRRYTIVQFEYTAAAVKAAADLNVELTQLITTAGLIRQGWVRWTVGGMRNSGLGNVLMFEPIVRPMVFYSFESVVSELKTRYYAHEARVAAAKQRISGQPCSNGIRVEHDHDLCLEVHGCAEMRAQCTALAEQWSVDAIPAAALFFRRRTHYDLTVSVSLAVGVCLGALPAVLTYVFMRCCSVRARSELQVQSSSEWSFYGHLLLAFGFLCSGWGVPSLFVLASASQQWWSLYGGLAAARALTALEMYALNVYPIRYVLVKGAQLAGVRVRGFTRWRELGAALALLVAVLVLLRSAIGVHGSIMGVPSQGTPDIAPVYHTRGMGAPTFQTSKYPVPIRVDVIREGCSLRGTMLTPQLLLVPRHFFYSVRSFVVAPPSEGSGWVLRYEGQDYPQLYNPGQINSPEGSDWAVVRVPNFRSCPYARVALSDPEPSGVLCGNSTGTLGPLLSGYPYRVLSCLLPLTKGDCGTPLTDLEGRLIGIYTGVIGSHSLVQQVSADVFREISLHGLPSVVYSTELPFMPPAEGLHPRSDAAWVLEASPGSIPFPVLGHVPAASTPQMTGSEALGFSVFKTMLTEPYVRPSSRGVPTVDGWHSLTTKKLRAAAAEPGIYDVDRMEAVVSAYVARFNAIDVGSEVLGPITFHQTLVGSEHNVYMAPRQSKKSSGPGLGRAGVTAEQAVVQDDPSTYTAHPLLLSMLSRYRETVACGIVPMTEGRCVMKDEMIPVSKYAQGGGRYFTVLDLAANLSLKMELGSIPSLILANPAASFCYAGINAGSGLAWQKLWDTLSDSGAFTNVLAADHSTFDTRHGVIKTAVHAVYDRLAKRLGHTPEQRRSLQLHLESFFWMELSMEGNFYVTQSMLASGRSDTIIFNSVANALIMGYAFGLEVEERTGHFPADPFSEVALATVGDDLLARCPREWETTFPATLVRAGALLGYKITSGVDKSELPAFIPFTQATFLKRTFVAHGDRAKAPLAFESIAKMMCYEFKSSITPKERLVNVACVAQRELFLHGHEEFASFQRLLDQASAELGFTIPRLSYDDLESEFQGECLRLW